MINPDTLRELNSSERVAATYSLEEMLKCWADYTQAMRDLNEWKAKYEKEVREAQESLAKVTKEINRISFGALLPRAIGLKVIAEKELTNA